MEYEADHIGLILMAKAGYDPREAPAFFERMMQNRLSSRDALNTPPDHSVSTHSLSRDQAHIEVSTTSDVAFDSTRKL
ncbi:MAG: hypothetical protein MZV63_57710 [Marinilabiliales bacterium]|nr:hypothetical protein [Marinilabiliales bacterium]